jgi:hypothetical protein
MDCNESKATREVIFTLLESFLLQLTAEQSNTMPAVISPINVSGQDTTLKKPFYHLPF